VVLSGDITQRARRSQFAAARRFTDALQAPHVLAIPGNHDIPLFNLAARVFAPYRNYSDTFGTDLEPTYESADMLILMLNTTRPRRHKDGEVSPQQVERVVRRLRAARPEQLRIIVTHQPVHAIRASDLDNLLHGYGHAVRDWAAAGADLILGGHIHLPYIRALRGELAGVDRDIWTVQAGTAVSSRIRDGVPNSVNVVSCAGKAACSIERWDFDAARNDFVSLGREELRLDRRSDNGAV
jgi:3',5'-cyclic AMP phosphodiesterase CpdA